ncbi:hypothetical protein D0Z07_2366 [Hyphodiscus hymeniophilus]|uniref:DUF202 domain-containing protein n=1 Tax=Hyphodiscus hymeniophilus TaxID=353542 RepID=A0A9P6VMK4_9HELO|nr:hypothetical protein D0Z07_2366 [Hyphodiscus hymeniophilus]
MSSSSPSRNPPPSQPTTPQQAAPSQTPNTSQPRRAPTRIAHSPRDRVHSILEGARQRKVAMDSSDENEPPPRRSDNANGNRRAGEEVESSADEETSIFRRSAQGMNYQSTNAAPKETGNGTGRARARRTQEVEAENEETGGGELESWWARFLSDCMCYPLGPFQVLPSLLGIHAEKRFNRFRLNTTAAQAGAGDPYKHLRQMGKPLGATFLGISILILGVGFHRYFEGQHWIIRGKFPASRGSIALVALVAFALMVTSLVIVIVVEPGAFEK